MRRRRLRLRLPLLLTVALAPSLGPVPATAAQEAPKVVAVLRFDNSTGDGKYDNLGRGLAAMMISDLSVLDQIRLVERERLEELQTELEFQRSAWADPATAQTTGLMMGAEYVVTGSFMTVDPHMLLGTRIVDVETSEIRKAAEVTGRSDQLFELQQRLAEEFIDGLELTLTEEDRARLRERQESNRVEDIETVLSFSRALCYVDAGVYDYALEEMLKVRDAAPGSVLFGVTLRLLRDRAASEARGRAEDQARGALGRLLGQNRPVPRHTLRSPGC